MERFIFTSPVDQALDARADPCERKRNDLRRDPQMRCLKSCHLRLVTISFAFCNGEMMQRSARAKSRPRRKQIADWVHVAIRTSVLDR